MEKDQHSDAGSAKRRVWVNVVAGVLIGAVFVVYMTTFTVREGEYGVLKTFGKITRTIDEPGLYWRWPLAQKVAIHDARLQTSEDGSMEQMITSDDKTILVMTFFTWKIVEVEKFDTSFRGSFKQAEENLQTIVRSAKGSVLGKYAFGDYIGSGDDGTEGARKKMRFEAIEDHLLKEVREKALRDFGIEIVQVGIKRLALPQDVSEKVFERMRSERKIKAESYRSLGDSRATEIMSQARLDRDLIVTTARARAKVIRAEGERGAAESYRVFAKTPKHKELHRFLKSLETLRLVSKKATIILDTLTPPFDLLGRGAILESGKDEAEEADEPENGETTERTEGD